MFFQFYTDDAEYLEVDEQWDNKEPMEIDEPWDEGAPMEVDEYLDEVEPMEVDDYKFGKFVPINTKYPSWVTPLAATINWPPQPQIPTGIVKKSVWSRLG